MRFEFCVSVILAKPLHCSHKKYIPICEFYCVMSIVTLLEQSWHGSVSDLNETLIRTVKPQVIASANLGNSARFT